MVKHFYVFRHGQTDMNIEKIFQGSGIDNPLNDKGREQAEKMAELLKDKDIEIIYSSPLVRAYETAIIANKNGIEIIKLENLKEACLGIVEGRKKEEIKEEFAEYYSAWRGLDDETFDARFPEGESKREVSTRIINTLTGLCSKCGCSVIGVSTHSAVIRYMLWHFGVKVNDIPNCGCYHLIYKDGKLELVD